MFFPIMFPLGDVGWSTGYNKKPTANVEKITKKDIIDTSKPKVNENFTALQYYLFKLSYRPDANNLSPLLYGGRLTQQYVIHAYIMVESNRMNYFRNHQKELRI